MLDSFNTGREVRGMAVIRLTCPWCGLEQSSCSLLMLKLRDQNRIARDAILSCGGCHRYILAEISATAGAMAANSDWLKWNGEIPSEWISGIVLYPAPRTADAPQSTPEKAAKPYSQAIRALSRGDWDAAGMMARKSLEQATGDLDQS